MAASRVAELEATVRNVLAKNERLEKELNQEREKDQDLIFKIRGKEEQFRQAQIASASNPSYTERERRLQAENTKLKGDNVRLLNQLQAEKASNVRPLYGMQREHCGSAYDRDDDNDLRSVTESASTTPAPSSSSGLFGRPFGMPQEPIFKKPKAFESVLDSSPSLCIRTKSDVVSTKKRKRTKQEEIEEELADLGVDGLGPVTGRRKKQCSTAVTDDDDFTFSVIYDYEGAKPVFMDSERIKLCKPLMERIRLIKDVWEHNKGSEWQFEFEKNGKTGIMPLCVTTKLAGPGKAKWRHDGAGKYACQHCVKNGRPCFTWTEVEMNRKDAKSWSLWEFRLLPLHLNDRARSVGKGSAAVRYWVNDEIDFQDKDVRTKDDGDELYVD